MAREEAGFLEMEVCHQQGILARPEQSPTLYQPQLMAMKGKTMSERKVNHGFPLPQADSLGKGPSEGEELHDRLDPLFRPRQPVVR
jgi:hypothetical protein